MTTSSRCAIVLCAALALPAAAQAQKTDRVFPAGADTVVEVRNLNGHVTVHSWNQPQVHVVAMKRSDAVEVHLEPAANRLHVHTHLLQSAAPASERIVDYEIWAPPDAQLQIYAEAGNVMVENFTDDVTVETVAADVALHNVSGYTSVKTLNGSLQAQDCSGRLEATSISGTLRFLNTLSRYLVANTTSGDIYYQGGFRTGGSYDFLDHEGSIELVVPADASFELNANSVQGQVINELPVTPRGHGRLLQRSSARSLLGTVLSGDAMVRVTSFSGTIRLRKQ